MRYLTWRQLFELREKLNLTEEQLSEPALFTVQDGHGSQTAWPVGYWTESIHPSDGTSTLCLAYDELEILLPGEFEENEADYAAQRALGEDCHRRLRQLPLGGLRLGFCEMDEDFEEATEWLAQPNPDTVPPPPPVPGPAPLFEQGE